MELVCARALALAAARLLARVDEGAQAALGVDEIAVRAKRLTHDLARAEEATQHLLPSRRDSNHLWVRISREGFGPFGACVVCRHEIVALLVPLGLLLLLAERGVAVEDGGKVTELLLVGGVLALARFLGLREREDLFVSTVILMASMERTSASAILTSSWRWKA